MRILVTGKNGFLAQNVIEYYLLKGDEVINVSHKDSLDNISDIDVVFHLAAVQRADKDEDFIEGNVNYTKRVLDFCSKLEEKPKIIFSSSTAVETDTIFAKTKKEAERLIIEYGRKYNKQVYIFRLNHIFGKYGKPHFNNVVSTFCYDIATNNELTIKDPAYKITITYINDLIKDFDRCVKIDNLDVYQYCTKKDTITLGKLVDMLADIKNEQISNQELYNNLKETYEYFKEMNQ